MIERNDILSLQFIKKTPFTGSFKGMRYRLSFEKEEENTLLCAVLWEGPYAYEAVDEEQKQMQEFAFSGEGISAAIDWLNGQWSEGKERFLRAKENW
ncbi:hypothetical protein FACS1894111_01310 [Clostridia bacterium]|nr:hypothetical protein FACS1894111_01310 [Clostridia bacterium]